jgi:hypothetical protein
MKEVSGWLKIKHCLAEIVIGILHLVRQNRISMQKRALLMNLDAAPSVGQHANKILVDLAGAIIGRSARCIQRLVRNAVRELKFRFVLVVIALSTVVTALAGTTGVSSFICTISSDNNRLYCEIPRY